MDNNNVSDEAAKSLLAKVQVKQPNSTVETSNIPGFQNQLQETSESEDSEEIEDVKVCDICGDAGLEELLAVCSRCSDGAEHTYCMQKKLKELPEGDWLCEACKFKEETGNQNDKLEPVSGALGVECLSKSDQNAKRNFDHKHLSELDTKRVKLEEREASERPQSPQISSKREEVSLEVDPKPSERVLESSDLSTRTADAKNKSLSREGSFNNLGADKAKQVKPAASCGGQSVNNSIFAWSQTFSGSNSSKMLDPVQSSGGPLSKSVSFNNSNVKSKVQFIAIPPHKQNLNRESKNTRKGQVKKTCESAALKNIRPGYSNADSVIKSQSLHPPQAEDHRGLKERIAVEKKIAMPEPPLANPAPVAGVSNLHSKVNQEVGIVSESKVLDINRGLQDKEISGCNEGKSLHVSKSFGHSSSIPTAQKPCQRVQKEDLHEVSGSADRSCIILNASSQRTAPQVVEFSHENAKMKDATFSGISKQAAPRGSGLLRCRKCNETGHPTQFCPIYKLPVTVLKHSADHNARDHHNTSKKTKDAASAPILKSAIQKDIRPPNHSEEVSILSANSSYEIPSKDLLSGSFSSVRKWGHLERTTYIQDTVRSVDDPSKRAASIDLNLQVLPVETSSVPRESNLNPIVSISDQFNARSLHQALSNTASVPADVLRSSVIPELEFIWQGGFEVLTSGRLSKYCEGVQAHLSTYASPKVLEAAIKFPCKVQLEEVTYVSSWPCQYQGHSPGEHNIALFFFAKDIESYEKNYSKLLEDMIKNDLALKGNIAGAELLVFPSNKLPKNSQRWNKLFFLWGVFRRRPSFSETQPQSQEKPLDASLNSETLVQNFPILIPEASASQKVNYSDILDTRISICDKLTELKEVKFAVSENFHSTSPSGPQMNVILPCSEEGNKAASLKNFSSEDRKVDPLHHEEKLEKGSLMKNDVFCGSNPGDKLIDSRPNRKQSPPAPMEIISHDADVTSECSDEIMHLNEKVDFPPVDDRREQKRLKPESRRHAGYSHQEENFSSNLSSKVHLLSASSQSHSFDGETAMPGSSSTDVSCLFPVELGSVSDTVDYKVISSSDGEGPVDIPNLELALGAKKKMPGQEALPPPSSNSGDDMAGSLSLSLAFHSSEKEL